MRVIGESRSKRSSNERASLDIARPRFAKCAGEREEHRPRGERHDCAVVTHDMGGILIIRTARTRPTLAALLALLPMTAAAQNIPTFSVSITEPSEIVEQVGTTRRITRADIESRNARTLDEALKLIPGIYVRTGGDGTPRVDVRGFRSRHVWHHFGSLPKSEIFWTRSPTGSARTLRPLSA